MNNGNEGFVVWLTGLSGAGKTTIANSLCIEINNITKKNVQVLDGDLFRNSFSTPLSFSKEDRYRNIETAILVTSILNQNGIPVIGSFISPYEDLRKKIRESVNNYIEVYLNTPLEVCRKRDVKGLYKRCSKGEISKFTGLDDVYEIPENPELIIDTSNETICTSAERIIDYLRVKEFLK